MKKNLTALFVFIPFLIQGQHMNLAPQHGIEVVGNSEMEITPDLIYLKIVLKEKDNKNKISVSELEKKMVGVLSEIGIDITKDLAVKDISSNFQYYLLAKNQILLSKEFQLIVRDPKLATKVFIELEKIGISNISIDRLDHTKILDFRKEVKINAIRAAREKAKFLAEAIDQTIGKALYIEEQRSRGYNAVSGANSIVIRGYNSNSKDDSLFGVDFEKIRLEYSILCRFELK